MEEGSVRYTVTEGHTDREREREILRMCGSQVDLKVIYKTPVCVVATF